MKEEGTQNTELGSCVKDEVAVLGSLSLISLMVDVKQQLKKKKEHELSEPTWPSGKAGSSRTSGRFRCDQLIVSWGLT